MYSKPAGTTALPNTTIASAAYNTQMDDFASDLNAARPVTAGGTGATAAAAALTNLGVSDFAKTLLDDGDAATARATLAIVEKVLRYDATQTLTGADLTQAQSNLKAILAGGVIGNWYEPTSTRVTAATGTAFVFDVPDTANYFRLTLEGLTIAAGGGSITLRCGPALGSADAAANDYLNKALFARDGDTSASAAIALANAGALGVVGAAGRSFHVIQGALGTAARPFQAVSESTEGDNLFNYIASRRITRMANGRKGRLFVYSDVALTGGTMMLEVKA